MGTPITISDRNKPARQSNHLTIGGLIFPRLDQIDMTGPFEVLSIDEFVTWFAPLRV
jgi:hypothetical protein